MGEPFFTTPILYLNEDVRSYQYDASRIFPSWICQSFVTYNLKRLPSKIQVKFYFGRNDDHINIVLKREKQDNNFFTCETIVWSYLHSRDMYKMIFFPLERELNKILKSNYTYAHVIIKEVVDE